MLRENTPIFDPNHYLSQLISMKRLILLVCIFGLFSCQDKVICPAFQSTYILDDSTRNAYFSYAWQLDEISRAKFIALEKAQSNPDDTLNLIAQPKTDYYAYAGEKVVPWRVQKRTKYGIIKNVPYPIKNYRLRTAPMENVLAPEPLDNFVGAEMGEPALLDSTAIVMDSLTLDSMATIAVEEEPVEDPNEPRFLYGYDPTDNFNVEQMYYNKYFAERLIDKRPKPSTFKPPVTDESVNSDSVQAKSPFMKELFKKKKDQSVIPDSVSNSAIPQQPAEEGNGG